MHFLQFGEIRAHRSAHIAVKEQELYVLGRNTRVMHATTAAEIDINTTEHATNQELTTDSKQEIAVWAYLMTHYNLKQGLRNFGEQGAKVAVTELTQLHITDTWTMMDPSTLIKEDRSKALSSLVFLKETCCGNIKGQACINGAPQRAYIPKEDAALPTVSTESLFSCLP
jgi:hypothetical protein